MSIKNHSINNRERKTEYLSNFLGGSHEKMVTSLSRWIAFGYACAKLNHVNSMIACLTKTLTRNSQKQFLL